MPLALSDGGLHAFCSSARFVSSAISHLLDEHREALGYLAAFERHLAEMHRDEQADIREASALLEYISEIFFVKHEEKEETVLLPELYRERLLPDLDELSRLREQHHRGQKLLDDLWKALRIGFEWDERQRREYLAKGEQWLRFIRGHLRFEEQYVFPKLQTLLDDELDRFMKAEFEKIDSDFRAVPDAQQLRSAAEEFVARVERSVG